MAKRICDPTTGSIGREVYLPGRNGQVVRVRAVPMNPQTEAQQLARAHFTQVARLWDTISEEDRQLWRNAAAQLQTRPVLGMSGVMTGSQLHSKLNCALLAIGDDPVSQPTPPGVPTTEMPTSLEITEANNHPVLKLVATSTPPDGSMLWGCPPCKPGVQKPPKMVFISTIGSPLGGLINITTDYVARFREPVAGEHVFVAVCYCIDGWEGPRVVLDAFCPPLE